MIINQTGVSSPFVFAGTGDKYVVRGVVTNAGFLTSPVIQSNQAGNTILISGTVASLGAADAITMTGGGSVTNNGLISGALTSDGPLSFNNTNRFVGFVVDTQAALTTGTVISNRGSMMLYEPVGATAHVAGALISLGASDDTVINRGKMMGNVVLGEGNNTFDGRIGEIMGSVFGGSGNDTYMFDKPITIIDTGGTDTIVARMSMTLSSTFENLTLGGFGNFAGTGNTAANVLIGNTGNNVLDGIGNNDTILGGAGSDVIYGGYGDDSLDGQNGADRVLGGFGNDIMLGGDGSDTLKGETGTDQLFGGNAADTLDGGIGSDTMDGGDGDDVLTGGAFGSDLLTGGLGADQFVYLTVDDSLATHAADVISDFEVGIDKIDLSALVAGDLVFVGSDPFSLVDASVRVAAGSGGTTVVSIDLDHNGTADMMIMLTGTLVLAASDFSL